MAKDRDRRDPTGKSKDPVERQAEEDVAQMKNILQRTKAELARSKRLADKIESRGTPGAQGDKKA